MLKNCNIHTTGSPAREVDVFFKNSVLYLSLQFEYGTLNFPTFPLPDGVTKADLGRKMVDFPERRNFLDEWVSNLQWHQVQGVWNPVINAERGGVIVREGNLLDWRFTRFPQVVIRIKDEHLL